MNSPYAKRPFPGFRARRTSAPSAGVSPRRSHQWTGAVLSDQRVALCSAEEPLRACDDRRQSGVDMTTEAPSPLIEVPVADQTVHDEESGARRHGYKRRRNSRHRNPSLTDNMEPVSCTETRPALRCPPHPFSEIVASLKATGHQQADRKP
ncbi:uncharacterized protein [Dermacentor andersoni]|uniref:uncharacterized protein n=1 Tax=Dermacentor andersoni TaxID=34620 RepID=UPI0024169B9D|nr:uncharacterized protein LOC129387145 [Dermacentor andersoni]